MVHHYLLFGLSSSHSSMSFYNRIIFAPTEWLMLHKYAHKGYIDRRARLFVPNLEKTVIFSAWILRTNVVSTGPAGQCTNEPALPALFCDVDEALRFCPVCSCGSGEETSCFFFDTLGAFGLEGFGISPIGAPGLARQFGQNHSPSGTADSGGSRQAR
jgi:hypothetical protein